MTEPATETPLDPTVTAVALRAPLAVTCWVEITPAGGKTQRDAVSSQGGAGPRL